MAAGKINLQANDGKVAGVVFEDGASSNVTVTVPKEGGVVATEAYADTKVSKTGDETVAGIKTFSSSPIVPVPALANQVISMGNIIEKTGAVLGYGIGSGGTVTQLTAKNYNVSLNKPTGTIITSDSALVSGQLTSFVFLNSLISINDTLIITPKGSINYGIDVIDIYNGAAVIRIINRDSISRSDAIQINFAVIKGAIA